LRAGIFLYSPWTAGYLSKKGEPIARVYINDVDQDVCLSYWLPKNSEKLEGLRFENVLFQLILFEDILDASAGAYPINPDNPQIRRQAWIYEPYAQHLQHVEKRNGRYPPLGVRQN
jgi:hypothetical protein